MNSNTRKHHHICAWMAALQLLLPPMARGAIQVVGSVTGATVETDPASGKERVVFNLSTGGQLEVAPFAADLVHVRWNHHGLLGFKDEVAIAKPFETWADVNPLFSDDGDVYRIETSELTIEVEKAPVVRVHFKDKSGYYLSRDDRMEWDDAYRPLDDSTYNNIRWDRLQPLGFSVKAVRMAPDDEAYFGLGQYAQSLNRRGHTIQGWNSDTFGWREDWNPMYSTYPFFYGVRPAGGDHPAFAYGIFFHNPSRPTFRMASEWNDRYSFEAGDGEMDYYFFGGGAQHTMPEVLTRYTQLTGMPTMLPKWAFGYHMSRWSYNNQDWIQWLADEFAAQDVPLDAIYVDLDYMDQNPDDVYQNENDLHQLTFNGNFPDPAGMINYCADRGVHLVPLVEPWLSTTDPKWQEAADGGYFTRNPDGSAVVTPMYFGVLSWLDFSNNGTRDWWRGKLLGFLDNYPFAGIWNDLNEPADWDQTPLNGLYDMGGRFGYDPNDQRRWHQQVKNTYCIREVSHTYETLREKYPSLRPFVLGRGGWPGVQRFCLGWSGDNISDYDHLRHNIRVGLSVMISGQVNFGHDVGGFFQSPDPEVITRWHEWGALTPFFRNHSMKWDMEREPFRFGEPYASMMRDSIKFRYQLMPYLYTLAHQSTETGIPMNTPAVFQFTGDPNTYANNEYDFMVGDGLLVAPVYAQGASDRWVYLPAGTDWYNWHNQEKWTGGGWVNVDAPLGTLPLFAKAGAIIPMGPSMQHANAFQPGYIDVHVWPAADGSFTLYEDDGETWDFLSGEYAKTPFTGDRTGDRWTFTVGAREGSYDPGERVFVVIAHDVGRPRFLNLNGSALPEVGDLDTLHTASEQGWVYDAQSRLLTVKFPDTAGQSVLETEFGPANEVLEWVGHVWHWPLDGDIDPGDALWINAETWPVEAAASVHVVYSTDDGATWRSADMTPGGRLDNNDWWHVELGTFPAGTTVRYAIEAVDHTGASLWSNNNGADYFAAYNAARPVQWIGNSYNWPLNGEIDPGEDLWINIESWPRDTALGGHVVYTIDEGATWLSADMLEGDPVGANDKWYVNLGAFPSGTHVRYAIEIFDGTGASLWDNNNGADHHAGVN